MAIVELLIIGLALSMDAFAVTLSNSIAGTGGRRGRALLMPVAFGFFQGLMPLIGYFLGSFATGAIASYAGIVAFLILALIGGKMAWEGIRELRKDASAPEPLPESLSEPLPVRSEPVALGIPSLLAQAVATSIDALIVGVSFLAMDVNIFAASSIVALTTFLCCLIALAIGRRFGGMLGDKAQIAGGIVLILIGVKALLF